MREKTAKQPEASHLISKPVLNLYEHLNVSTDASEETIRAAYRTLAKACHPDLNPRSIHSETAFMALNAAAKVLLNTELRALYDQGAVESDGTLVEAPAKSRLIWMIPIGGVVFLASTLVFAMLFFSILNETELEAPVDVKGVSRADAPVAGGNAVRAP